MTNYTSRATAIFAMAGIMIAAAATPQAEAKYTGSGPACVSGIDALSIHGRKSRRSRVVGYLFERQCGMNIEAVEGRWTYIRGSYRGRNVQGWVRNRFLRAKETRGTRASENEENNVASAKSCRRFGNVRSRNSQRPISVRFTNRTRGERSVMWLDYNGRPKEYKRLAPGQSYVQQTFAGHPWMFTDGPGNCKELFIPNGKSRRYVISFDR